MIKNYIAIDIAKDTLQVQSDDTRLSVGNDAIGIKKILEHAKDDNAHVVCEATGGYERLLVDTLHDAGVTVSLINAARTRAFAQSDGLKAKTDDIDAKSLLEFAKQKDPRPTPAPDPAQRELRELLDRRSQLTEQIAREKNRLHKGPKRVRASIKRSIDFIEGELHQIEKDITGCVQSNDKLSAKMNVLEEIKGVGKTTALTVLAYLSEIETLGRSQITALAGLAPYNRDSGATIRKRRIDGGRAKVRKCLYMAAQSAARFNPVIAPYVSRLLEAGKAYKCAMVAAMRKLLLYMKAQLKNLDLALES